MRSVATIRRTGKHLFDPTQEPKVFIEHDGYAIWLYEDDFDKVHMSEEQWDKLIVAFRRAQEQRYG
jgi:hypothetical protein